MCLRERARDEISIAVRAWAHMREKRKKVINRLGQLPNRSSRCSSANRPNESGRGGYRPLTLPSAATKSGGSAG